MKDRQAFETLGLAPTAAPDEVKARWRELASKHHPDRAGGDNDEFVRCKLAYEQAYAAASRPKKCNACGGSGKESQQHGFKVVRVTCRFCKGKGEQ